MIIKSFLAFSLKEISRNLKKDLEGKEEKTKKKEKGEHMAGHVLGHVHGHVPLACINMTTSCKGRPIHHFRF